MQLTYSVPSFEYMINSILDIQMNAPGDFFKQSLFQFYPNIERNMFVSLSVNQQTEYLNSCLEVTYRDNYEEFLKKVDRYNAFWNENKAMIIEAFEDAFKIDLQNELNDMQGYICLNPVSPRFLESHSFEVFWMNSERGALGVSLHEIVHFIWFKIWNGHFHDDIKDYENPHLKWIFSEMIPEIIMRDERLKSRNPYYADGCVYDYFYKITIEGEPILEILHTMFLEMPIKEFMEKGYNFCISHEEDIRKVMY